MDAVGRAKDELVNADDASRGAVDALQRLSVTFGMTQEAEKEINPIDESGLWESSVEYVSKRHIANAAEVFQQALKSSSSQVHGPRRILRKDLTPVLCALKPGFDRIYLIIYKHTSHTTHTNQKNTSRSSYSKPPSHIKV